MHELPTTGGLNAYVVVTMTLDTLLGGLQAASLLSGHQLCPPRRPASAKLVRRE